jgi:hypothetical protein
LTFLSLPTKNPNSGSAKDGYCHIFDLIEALMAETMSLVEKSMVIIGVRSY